MRALIIIVIILTGFTLRLSAQASFAELDRLNYQHYLAKDYKNLKSSAKQLLEQGSDYYYLRMRLGILAYENHRYASAYKNFNRAKQLNPFDTISNEYLYYSYLFSGRTAGAKYFLRKLPDNQKNNHLRGLPLKETPEISFGYSYVGYDVKKFQTNPLNYEAIENLSVFNAGLSFNFTENAQGFLQYSNTRKVATFYSPSNPAGDYGTFKQNELYFRYKTIASEGWEVLGYTHWVFFTTESGSTSFGRRSSTINLASESLFGLSLVYNGWYLRSGLGINYSNFQNSKQLATEGYITYLPFSNLSLYSSISGYYQVDKNWGNTYQSSFELGFKVLKHLWFESGVRVGNSVLYSRNFGALLNNSFVMPSAMFYGNLVIPTSRFTLRIAGVYSKIDNYSWDLVNYTKTSKVELNSYGINASLTIKFQ